MPVLDTNVTDILVTQEYQDDVELLTGIVVNSLGVESYLDSSNPFIYALCSLSAIHRYFIRHQVDLVDIDITPYLSLIQKEIGLDLPLSDDFSLLEWLRENKSWYGHRGTLAVYPFIGSLTGSPLEIDFPSQLVFRMDSTRSCLDGALTGFNSPLPFPESKLARLADGILWAQFTYVVQVLQAQNLVTFTDLLNLLQNVHPAGTKMFLTLDYNFGELTVPTAQPGGYMDTISDYYLINSALSYATLDNGWMLDGPTELDMHNGTFFVPAMVVKEIPGLSLANAYRQLPNDTLTNQWIGDDTYAGMQRAIANGDGTYTQVYADNDSIVYVNCTTNIGLSKYTLAQLTGLTLRQLKYCAFNNDAQNMDGQAYMPQLLFSNLTIT